MKTSRISAAVVATLALFAADQARAADPVGTTAVLNTYSSIWPTDKGNLVGDALGPVQNGAPRIGKNTGAGYMDAHFAWDSFANKTNPGEVLLGTVFTRSSLQANNNNSYMQGGFATAKLTEKGIVPGIEIDLPQLNGERAFMRPEIVFTPNHILLFAASEDNGVNNNPQIVLFVANKATGALVQIPNSTRGTNINKPTNIVQQALKDGINVPNPNNQRGPHSIVQVTPNSVVIGNQYNNDAQEAFRISVADTGTVKVDWFRRFSDTAQHSRPQVVIADGAATGFITAVEANNQPAEIGIRASEFEVATGKVVQSKIVVRSEPNKNKYVSEPIASLVGDKLAISYGLTSKARDRNGNNGHAGGAHIATLALFDKTLTMVGTPLVNASQFGRHSHSFGTQYGPNGEPAVAVISGSSTGTGKGFQQLIPLKADGTLGLKDPMKVYTVSQFADVANVQARGKRNPNNQAKGFINGIGSIPNPGYNKGNLAFMPEVKMLSFSTITGATTLETAQIARRNSIYLSLVPAAWKEGLATIPGGATDKPGVGPDGQPSQTGPAPRTTGPGTNPSGDATGGDDTNVLEGTDGTNPNRGRGDMEDNSGCSVSSTSSSTSGAGLIGLAVAAVLVSLRRRAKEEK